MAEKIRNLVRQYPIATVVVTFLLCYAGYWFVPTPNEATAVLQRALLSAALFGVMALAGGAEALRWEKGSFGRSFRLGKSVLLVTAGMAVFALIVSAFTTPVQAGWAGRLAFSAIDALTVGLFEESWFRGVFQSGIVARTGKTRGGMTFAVVFSGMAFGFLHVATDVFSGSMTFSALIQIVGKTLQTGFVGILLGAVFLATKNIWAAALIHALNDFILFTVSAFFGGGEVTSYVDRTSSWVSELPMVLFMVALHAILLVAALRILKKLPLPQAGLWKTPQRPEA